MSLAANRDFRKLWAAQAVSGFGATIAREGPVILAATLGLILVPLIGVSSPLRQVREMPTVAEDQGT